MKMVKKVLCLVLMMLMLATSFIGPMSLNASAVTTKTVAQATSWLEGLVGSKVGSGQCVALIKAYYEYLGAPTPYGNACDYATNSLPSGWQRIKGATPQAGDVLIWTQGYQNYGHVAICGGNGKYYHQNWGGLYVQALNQSYTGGFSISSGAYRANYWGVIRPDFSSSSISYINLAQGEYFIRNQESGQYLTISNGVDAENQKIHMRDYSASDISSQGFKIYKVSGGYEIMPFCSSTRVVNPYCWTVESGKTVNLYSKTNENSQWWKFEKVNNAYAIRNVQNPSVCLANPSGDSITVETYVGTYRQLWYLEEIYTVKFDANGGNGVPTSQKICSEQKFVVPQKVPTKKCAIFMGWATTKNGSASIKPNVSTRITKNTTLYAVWKENHNYSPATYTTPKTCKLCGATSGNKLVQGTNSLVTNSASSSSINSNSSASKPEIDSSNSKPSANSTSTTVNTSSESHETTLEETVTSNSGSSVSENTNLETSSSITSDNSSENDHSNNAFSIELWKMIVFGLIIVAILIFITVIIFKLKKR